MTTKSAWCISCRNDIEGVAAQIDVQVPPRGLGRTKDHTERYAFARMLPLVADRITYPLSIVHSDKPDFVITTPTQNIGIEHVEIIPENNARSSVLQNLGHGDPVQFVHRAEVNEKKKNNSELIAELKGGRRALPWMGDASERDTAKAVVHFVHKKIEISQKAGFQRLQKNWLLMYNNWPGAGVNVEAMCEIASPQLRQDGVFGNFDLIVLIANDHHLVLFEDSGHQTSYVA